MAASLVGLGLFLGAAAGQEPYPAYPSRPASTFQLPGGGPAPDVNRFSGLTPNGIGMPSFGTATPAPSSWDNPTVTAASPAQSGTGANPSTAPSSGYTGSSLGQPRRLTLDKQASWQAPPIQRVSYQAPGRGMGASAPAAGGDETPGYQIPLTPPGPGRLFTLDSEAQLIQRIIQENRGRNPPENAPFPTEPVLSQETYAGRRWPQLCEIVEPNYVCYGRLWYEDKNTERYGWEFGIAQPIVSAAKFYMDLATVPYKWGAEPCRCQECSAGYCLPGDPVPYLIYPPILSFSGAAAEAATVAGLLAIFP